MRLTALLLLLSTTLHATEFFVNKEGLDANAGTSREAAFLTIQKGVDALQPGDTLTIGREKFRGARFFSGAQCLELHPRRAQHPCA